MIRIGRAERKVAKHIQQVCPMGQFKVVGFDVTATDAAANAATAAAVVVLCLQSKNYIMNFVRITAARFIIVA